MAHNLSTLQDLSAGDVILMAKPVVHVVYSTLKGKHCDNCLMKSSLLKKCGKCLSMYYCGRDCQRNDWNQHKNECKFMSRHKHNGFAMTDRDWLLFRLWLRLVSDPTFAANKHKLMDGSEISFEKILVDFKANLITYREDISSNKKLEEVAFNIFFMLPVVTSSYKDFVEDLFLLWLVINSPICQPLDWCSSDTDRDLINNVGLGIFPQLFSVGHSCLPNSAIVTTGMKIIINI